MRYLIFGVLLMLAARASASPGLGDSSFEMSPDGVNEVGLTLGGFQPTGRFGFRGIQGDKSDTFGSNGFFFAADYLHPVVPILSLGGELGYIVRGDRDVSNVAVGTAATTRVRGTTTLLMAIARLRAPGIGWRPYALLGAGVNWTHLDIFATAPGSTESPVDRGTSDGLALMGRAGVEYVSKKGTFLGLEAGYLHTNVQTYSPTANAAGLGYTNIQTSGDGVSYGVRAGVTFGLPDSADR